MYISRPNLEQMLAAALGRAPVVVLTGPRQCGKTTLARTLVPESSVNYFDLEDPLSLARLDEPMTALAPLRGLVVIDEIQRRPDLFPILRVLADRLPEAPRFLILGSASGDLLRQSSESLAGRRERIDMSGFTIQDMGTEALSTLWIRGGFPRSTLATSDDDSFKWRDSFIQTLLERDFAQWGIQIPAATLHRFWSMLAHMHGQTWNAAQPARALGISESSARRYIDILTDALMVRQVQPWIANLKKRQVKSPRVYIRDSGVLHALLRLSDTKSVLTHPKVGVSWEGYAIEQILSMSTWDDVAFWSTHQGAEMDLVLRRGSNLFGVEIKRTDAPRTTRSITVAKTDLGLREVFVVYPGPKIYSIADGVSALPLACIQELDARTRTGAQ